MKRAILWRSLFIPFLSLLFASTLFAQTAETGAIQGTVKSGGAAIPGVTLELRSPALQGVRTVVTDPGGNFRFTLLPPGRYTLRASLSGFNNVTQSNIAVAITKTVTLDVTISPAASEAITVTGAAPVVDVTSNISGANVTSQTMQSLPIGRNYVSAAQMAPGTSTDASGTTVYGSTGAENGYLIDGLNTTGIGFGQQGKRLNFDFIDEVGTLTGGLPAEYGRLTGGVINAVTKSGSNEFHGGAFGYAVGGGLVSKNTTAADRPGTSTTIGNTRHDWDGGASLGGFFVKDHAWFYAAIDHENEQDISQRINVPLSVPGFSVPVGGTVPSTTTRNLYAGKLSLAITASHQFNVSILGDPSTTNGALFGIAGPPSTFNGTLKTGGNDYIGRYSGVFGSNWNLNAEAGRHQEKQTYGGAGASLPLLSDRSQVPNVLSGGFGFYTNHDYKRTTYKADVSAFYGSHEIKFGGDHENQPATNENFLSGGAWIRKQCLDALVGGKCPDPTRVYYIHEVYLNDLSPTFKRGDSSTWSSNILVPLASTPRDINDSAYIQDSWKALSNFTIDAGVRLEQQKASNRFGDYVINLKHNIAPRIGLIWDPLNNGRSKVYANYGRFYEAIPMDINFREFGGEVSLDVNNFDPTANNLTPDPNAPKYSATKQPYRILGGGTGVPVDQNLKGQYVDEFLLGADYEIAPALEVGVKATSRNLGRVIEDFLVPSTGDYLVANPGLGLGAEGGTINGDTVSYGPAKRRYTGVEIHAQKRFSNNYQFFTSYVWSRLKGNYDGTFQVATGQLDPNINSAFDYADFLVNNNGYLANDRTHVVKFYGSYTFTQGMVNGLDLGVGFHWESGLPLTAMGFAQSYRNWEYYLTPRGSLGRGPSDYEADFHAGFPLAVGGGSKVTLLMDIFNVFNRQAATALDMRYNLSSDPTCSGVPDAICNGDGGILNVTGTTKASGQLTNARATATNPDFLKKGTAFTSPRSIRFGARWTF